MAHKGIHDRGYLPHWDFPDSIQAITFRLADSVPAALIKEWKLWMEDYHDCLVRDINRFENAANYIPSNPVKADLCELPSDWEFSSAGQIWSADFSPPEPSIEQERQAD